MIKSIIQHQQLDPKAISPYIVIRNLYNAFIAAKRTKPGTEGDDFPRRNDYAWDDLERECILMRDIEALLDRKFPDRRKEE